MSYPTPSKLANKLRLDNHDNRHNHVVTQASATPRSRRLSKHVVKLLHRYTRYPRSFWLWLLHSKTANLNRVGVIRSSCYLDSSNRRTWHGHSNGSDVFLQGNWHSLSHKLGWRGLSTSTKILYTVGYRENTRSHLRASNNVAEVLFWLQRLVFIVHHIDVWCDG